MRQGGVTRGWLAGLPLPAPVPQLPTPPCGIQIRFLVEHRMVSCLVTTAGGIEEDLMKCLAPHFIGSSAGVEGFNLKGIELRKKGINRIGNLLVRAGWEANASRVQGCPSEPSLCVRTHFHAFGTTFPPSHPHPFLPAPCRYRIRTTACSRTGSRRCSTFCSRSNRRPAESRHPARCARLTKRPRAGADRRGGADALVPCVCPR